MEYKTIRTLKGNVLTFDELVAMNGYDIAHSDDKRDYFLTYYGDKTGYSYWKVQTIRVRENGELMVSASNANGHIERYYFRQDDNPDKVIVYLVVASTYTP